MKFLNVCLFFLLLSSIEVYGKEPVVSCNIRLGSAIATYSVNESDKGELEGVAYFGARRESVHVKESKFSIRNSIKPNLVFDLNHKPIGVKKTYEVGPLNLNPGEALVLQGMNHESLCTNPDYSFARTAGLKMTGVQLDQVRSVTVYSFDEINFIVEAFGDLDKPLGIFLTGRGPTSGCGSETKSIPACQ